MARPNLALLISASTAALVWAPTSKADDITFAQGQVFVNHGSGFKPATGHDELNSGDTVFTKPGGQANITFGDGCNFTVQPGSALVIRSGSSPCADDPNSRGDKIPVSQSSSNQVNFQNARAVSP